MSRKIRLHLIFEGQVQGVGFRASTLHISTSFDVKGTVENLENGAVQMVVEGAEDELNVFLKEIQHRLGRYIRSIRRDEFPATGEFDEFSIRY
jgi:acylphosphatase